MEWLGVVLVVVGLPVALAIWLSVRTVQTSERLARLTDRLSSLEGELARLNQQLNRPGSPAAPEPATTKTPSRPMEQTVAALQRRVEEVRQPVQPTPAMLVSPPPPAPAAEPGLAAARKAVPPPPIPPPSPASAPASPSPDEPTFFDRLSSGKVDWEQFVGVKLLMWLGGLAAFLTVVFAVKYSFEKNWITPELRVAAGFLTGVGLLVAGVFLHRRKQYMVGAQTFCATGIVILYATTFACRSIYHFESFGLVPTFLLMVLITATAFMLAVRLEARVVAILGICGGFLTPVLLSTGEDNPLGLFGYIALLDAGLMAVALRKRWHFLTLLGAAGTVLMEVGWVAEFFVRERYFEGDKVLIALAVYLGFGALFVAAWFWARRQQQTTAWLTASAIALPALALGFGFYLMGFEPLGQRPGLVFGYVLLADLCLLSLVWEEAKLAILQMVAGAAVFLLLTVWTLQHLSDALLDWALAGYLLFAALHSALPFVIQRLRPGVNPLWWGHLFPPVALLLMLIPIFKLHTGAFVLWPFALLVDLLVIVLAALSASVVWILLALVLTILAAGCWIGFAPAELTELPVELLVIGGFAVFFIGAGIWVARRLGAPSTERPAGSAGDAAGTSAPPGELSRDVLLPQVPAFSAVLPFLLLIMVTLRLPLTDPSPVFGLALLLVVLLLGLTRLFPLSWLPAVGLGCVLALEHAWHFERFKPDAAVTPLLWYLGFTLLFLGFPFVFWRSLAGRVVPWATAALAGPLHFYLVHRLVKAAWPNDYMGLLPLAFALPATFGLAFLIRSLAADAPKRNTLLALFGAATLFFVTLVFPIQFDRQWITLGWALEGTALLWLFHRVPHNGLRLAGVGLLVVAFARLALNPAVLHYHARAATPIFNWYLYAYSLTAACLFLGARLLAPPRHLVLNGNARAILATLGTLLAFLLLNLEIADYFTAEGAVVLTFQFSGDLARDMTYSIGWGLFALGLVLAGILGQIRAARYAGIALLGATLLKLFLHDLANLQALYRIGALLGVAIVAIAASFLYQRFFAGVPRQSREQPGTSPGAPSA